MDGSIDTRLRLLRISVLGTAKYARALHITRHRSACFKQHGYFLDLSLLDCCPLDRQPCCIASNELAMSRSCMSNWKTRRECLALSYFCSRDCSTLLHAPCFHTCAHVSLVPRLVSFPTAAPAPLTSFAASPSGTTTHV